MLATEAVAPKTKTVLLDTVGAVAEQSESLGGEGIAAHRPVGSKQWVPETWASLRRLRKGSAAGRQLDEAAGSRFVLPRRQE